MFLYFKGFQGVLIYCICELSNPCPEKHTQQNSTINEQLTFCFLLLNSYKKVNVLHRCITVDEYVFLLLYMLNININFRKSIRKVENFMATIIIQVAMLSLTLTLYHLLKLYEKLINNFINYLFRLGRVFFLFCFALIVL